MTDQDRRRSNDSADNMNISQGRSSTGTQMSVETILPANDGPANLTQGYIGGMGYRTTTNAGTASILSANSATTLPPPAGQPTSHAPSTIALPTGISGKGNTVPQDNELGRGVKRSMSNGEKAKDSIGEEGKKENEKQSPLKKHQRTKE